MASLQNRPECFLWIQCIQWHLLKIMFSMIVSTVIFWSAKYTLPCVYERVRLILKLEIRQILHERKLWWFIKVMPNYICKWSLKAIKNAFLWSKMLTGKSRRITGSENGIKIFPITWRIVALYTQLYIWANEKVKLNYNLNKCYSI